MGMKNYLKISTRYFLMGEDTRRCKCGTASASCPCKGAFVEQAVKKDGMAAKVHLTGISVGITLLPVPCGSGHQSCPSIQPLKAAVSGRPASLAQGCPGRWGRWVLPWIPSFQLLPHLQKPPWLQSCPPSMNRMHSITICQEKQGALQQTNPSCSPWLTKSCAFTL